MRYSLHPESEQDLREADESITLKPEDFQAFLAFLAALDAPAKPNAALHRTFKRHGKQVR